MKFMVNDLNLSIIDNKPDTKMHFKFSGKEWRRCKVVAVFEYNREEYPVPVEPDGFCVVPNKVANSYFFRLRLIRETKTARSSTNILLVAKEA